MRGTQLLSPFEKISAQNLLRGPDADRYVSAAATFALKGTKNTFLKLVRMLEEHQLAKWTLATYLPLFWKPDEHMYLKPESTKDYAERVGHPLALVYEAKPTFETYQSTRACST